VVGVEQRRYFGPSRLRLAQESILSALNALGASRPVSRGALADAAELSSPAAQALLEDLIRDGAAVARGPGFQPAGATPLDEGPLTRRLLEILHADFLEPRSPQALAAELEVSQEEVRDLLERAALAGHLSRVKPGVFYHPDALAEAKQRVVLACERDGSVSIALLRDHLGTSRKYAQALLEHFDSSRLTRRQGDVHVLRRGISLRADSAENRS
jgi:DNA-binding Lrp family transcriptional regulator